MTPIPVPQWCAELTAHILRWIQDVLKNTTHYSVIVRSRDVCKHSPKQVSKA